ncbi:MAG TPA: DUF885 family protein, partial [Candidatus Limnocylindria bacterium]|nr:DUF885 family protein [Candidatus Limnocylindria bacterium]
MASAFTALVDTFLTETYEDSPTLASSLGLTEYDERLDATSARSFQERIERDHSWLARFRAVADADLSPAERIDRDLLVSVLHGRTLVEPLESWRRQPATYLNPGLNGVFTLFLHRLRPEGDLADAARARLAQVPRTIADGMANLDLARTPPVYLERAVGQAKAAATYARELVPNEVQDPSAKRRLAETGAVAAKAFEEYAAFLESSRVKAAGDFAIGEELYTAMLTEKELLPFGARALREKGSDQWDLLSAEADRIAKEIDGGTWQETCDRLNKVHAPTPEGMR